MIRITLPSLAPHENCRQIHKSLNAQRE